MTKVHIPYRPDTRFERRSDLVSRVVAGETMIVPVRGGVGDLESVYTVRGAAQTIWEMVGEGATLGEIENAVVEQYDVEPKQAAKDVRAFLADLVEEGLAVEKS